MSEEFLYFIWQNKLFKADELYTSDGEAIEVLSSGTGNSDSGPDFFNAKIKIGNTIWAGNVEIHKKSSDWFTHNHHHDSYYDTVILHIVLENNKLTLNSKGNTVNTSVLTYNKIFEQKYLELLESKNWINCEKKLSKIELLSNELFLTKLAVERLEKKTIFINELLKYNNNNWEETFYQLLARNFGFNTNSIPFELLAKSIPQKILSKHKDSLFLINALLLGQAGFIEFSKNKKDFYEFEKDYYFLKHKYNLTSIDFHLWKFMRIRPNNFPNIRISQFANLIYNSSNLFSKVIEIEYIDELKRLFEFDFTKNKGFSFKKMGLVSVENIIINSIIPILFLYGKTRSDDIITERALMFSQNLKSEQNNIIKKWISNNIIPLNSFHSQALIQLKKEYCDKNKCISCYIGNKIIKSEII